MRARSPGNWSNQPAELSPALQLFGPFAVPDNPFQLQIPLSDPILYTSPMAVLQYSAQLGDSWLCLVSWVLALS